MTETLITRSEEETVAAGRALSPRLDAGATVLLTGDLGAGKTAFVRGLASGLGIEPGEVSSPTFTLIQEYRGGRLPLMHVDLYRLSDSREIEELGLDELGVDAVMAIEWAERLSAPPPNAVRVSIEHAGDLERRLTIET
jgi:tRNA threonylcarbamoyladenosine biosynthesis protein TsaE